MYCDVGELSLIRTNVHIKKAQLEELRALSARIKPKKTVAWLIRQAIDEFLDSWR
jgi:hypothetical protein